ncbi:hypothetical protein [Pseudomonas sp. rhizo25]|uniref:hypothetical protein n=1 Tax=Pseudomonas sp. rhizo25 TaxID=3059675 RepID=UPI00288D1A65|nr:hypothetical protein [Pseudomonas sp. rhizo25]MDT3228173.1 hypothetical protein [Pseudomonas sp. rhizo25]
MEKLLTIKSVHIENVKGIENQTFELNIIPNKPSLLVAPNGFGKSSFAAAFASLNSVRLAISKDHMHQGDEDLKPKLSITVANGTGLSVLNANNTSNSISSSYDVHVISNRLIAKSTKRNMGKFTTASASIAIDPFVLVSRIPKKVYFSYSCTQMRVAFGRNGKILRNIEHLLNSSSFIGNIQEMYVLLDKFTGTRIQQKIDAVLKKLNHETGTAEELRLWAASNITNDLAGIDCVNSVSALITTIGSDSQDQVDALLSAYQICVNYTKDKDIFKCACKYRSYLYDKAGYEKVITSFDTTWKNIRPAESAGKLIVEFPAASNISNGQRDSLCFAVWLQKVNNSQNRKDCILVIDEVFDYLDDANLVAVQYYISNLIAERKSLGLKIYPLILTHLNPIYFRNFIFKDQKVYFLKKSNPALNQHFKKLIINRSNSTIASGVAKHHLHYHPIGVNLRIEFQALGLKETWGDSEIFHIHTQTEWQKYLNGNDDYDPFAVCCYVRVKIEKIVYGKITSDGDRTTFLNTNGTKEKLGVADAAGIDVSETLYLLGVIYNEGMHVKEHVDNSSPIVAKLENLTIRKMLVESTAG